jgi:hypothetical protein
MYAKDKVCAGLRPKVLDDFQPKLILLLEKMWNGNEFNRPIVDNVLNDIKSLDSHELLATETVRLKGNTNYRFMNKKQNRNNRIMNKKHNITHTSELYLNLFF